MQVKDEDLAAQRQQLRQWLQANVAGQHVQHPALLTMVLLNWQGLKHCLSSTSLSPHIQFQALYQLPQLVQKATYSHYEADNHTPPRRGVGVHILYADCEVAGSTHQLWIRVRETPDGLYFYDLGVVQ